MLALGIKESVLTAKHGCGFCTWPTKATLPDGKPYGYNVQKELDVLGPYVKSMRKAGIGHGFYYSLDSNYYLQRGLNATAVQFEVLHGRRGRSPGQFVESAGGLAPRVRGGASGLCVCGMRGGFS